MKRIIQMATISLVGLFAGSSYAQQPPAGTAPAEVAPVSTPAQQAPMASTALGGGMLAGVDARLTVPLGDLSNIASVGFGALGRYEYILTPQVNLTGRAGIDLFVGKNNASYWNIPILVGAKFAVIPNLYLAGELGLFYNHVSVDLPFIGSASNGEFDFAMTLGAGYRMGDLDFRASVEFADLSNAGSTTALVLSAGYNFWRQ